MSFNATEEECEGRETFPIYLLSLLYSILAALIIALLIFRWHWRRRKLSRFRSSKPGDKSFKNKHMQAILKEDFAFVESLSPDPRLVNKNHTPREFGECPEGSEFPAHWHKMEAFDAAADFVSAHIVRSPAHSQHPRSSHPPTLTLPEFLRQLELAPAHQRLIEATMELYAMARYKDEVFGQDKLREFQANLQRLKEILNRNGGTTEPSSLLLLPPSLPSALTTSAPLREESIQYRQSVLSYTSQDPLLRMSSTELTTPDDPLQSRLPQQQHRTPKSDTRLGSLPTIPSSRSTARKSASTPSSQGSSSKRLFSSSSKKKRGTVQDPELSPLMSSGLHPGSPLSLVTGFGQLSATVDESSESEDPLVFPDPQTSHTDRTSETQV